MNEVPFYKSIKFFLLLFSVFMALIFLGQMLLFVAGAVNNIILLVLTLLGFLFVWLNMYFITSRFDKELTLLRESIRMVIANKFSRKFKLRILPVDDEIGIISREVGQILEKAHQRTTELLLRRKELELAYNSMERLASIGRTITSFLDINLIIQATFDNVSQILDASLLAIGIYNSEQNGIDFYGIKNGAKTILHGFDDMSDPKRWSVYCFQTQKELLCNEYDVCSGMHFSSILFNESNEKRESFIYLPLSILKTKIGLFTVQSFNRNAYTAYHQGLMRNLANYLAIAIQNSNSLKKIENQKEELFQSSIKLREINETLELLVDARTAEIVQKNVELERLSLVARKTSNAIMIMDATGNIQWLNDSFTKIYNYTYEEFIAKRGKNIINTSFNPNIKATLQKCLSSKQAVYYEALNITGDGKEIWTQTTLTPVLNSFDEITHLLTIDSDITHRKRNELMITRQALDITYSIQYAKRIQSAIIPPKDWLSEKFKDFFIFFRPKDIVSGDFYWTTKNHHKTIVVVGDCTGHGVPGAFMSMLGISLLNEIVLSYKINSAAEILNLLREKIKTSLRQSYDNLESADGMDIALCIFDLENNVVDYSGAYNSLYMIRNNSLTEYKGNKMPIGLYINDEIPFTGIEIDLMPGDKFYMTTDGYIDQFGGEDDSKFMIRRFKEMIFSIHQKTMKEQKQIVEKTFFSWKGNENAQIDDICVLGIEI